MTEVSAYFDGRAEAWTSHYDDDPRFARRRDRILGTIERHVFQHLPCGEALDFGCGSGVFSRALVRDGWHVLGIDASFGMIAAAEKHSVEQHTELLEFRHASLGEVNETFDLVIALSVLEYIDDDEAILRQLVSKLKHGGTLVISVPNKRGMVRRVESLVRNLSRRSNGRLFGNRGDYLAVQSHQYTPAEFDKRLSRLGLTKREGLFLNSGFRNASLAKLLEREFWAALYCGIYSKP